MSPANRLAALLGGALALNRTAFGLRFLLQPGAAGPTWVGRRSARRRPVKLFVRAVGARDVGLGLGALAALRRGDTATARRWMLAHALADGADLAATLSERDGLPARPSRFALAAAGASTAVAAVSAALLGGRQRPVRLGH